MSLLELDLGKRIEVHACVKLAHRVREAERRFFRGGSAEELIRRFEAIKAEARETAFAEEIEALRGVGKTMELKNGRSLPQQN